MRVLVACEFSGAVRDAFIALGHDALSCDLIPSETPGPHHIGDVREILNMGWDAMVAHPPCTLLAASGARWWAERREEQEEAIEFVKTLWEAPISRVAIENPVGILSTRWRAPDQYIHPWMFGHPETKKTGLWLRGLPPLMYSLICEGREQKILNMPRNVDRAKNRSRTYPGIATAMAKQWGG